MNKTWIFFKLRMMQLKSDKTALFFCYVLPVLLLLGIGYPLQLKGDPRVALYYSDTVQSESSRAFTSSLKQHTLVNLQPYADAETPARAALAENELKHYLEIRAAQDPMDGTARRLEYHLYANSLPENRVENAAVHAAVDAILIPQGSGKLTAHSVTADIYTSYLVTLLPGVIGMTLLVIGLNGFGAVLIEEEHFGLFKNVKTIDASPVAFLGGLLVSRMLVAYSVVAALYAIGVLVFGIPVNINYPLLALVITLGCISFLGVGLLLAIISPSATAFNGIVNFVQMPFIILGGVFFSINTFPDWLKAVANLIPLTQLNTAMREILFSSVGFGDISKLYPAIAVMTVWSVVTLVFARMKFRW